MKLLGMWSLPPIDPHLLVEAHGIHNECIALPLTDGVSIVAWHEVLRVIPAVGVNRPESMGPPIVQDEDALDFGNLDNLDTVRGGKLTGRSVRLASSVRF